jgi:hypothetical protein
MEEYEDMLDDARLCGRSEAETFDRALRERELREREERLTRMAWGASEEEAIPHWAHWAEPRAEPSQGAVWRLQQDVERLASFHHAVLHSRAWKMIQAFRRPFGRAW